MKRDRVTDVGLLIVGLAAAVLTFTTLRDLAAACGITETIGPEGFAFPLSYLVPITVDAAGVVAARVWLRQLGNPRAVDFARGLAWSCIGLSVAGNAGQHGMAAYGLAAPWWVVVIVSAVPPASLGAVVHLGHLIGQTAGDTGQETGNPAMPAGNDKPAEATTSPAETAADQRAPGVPATLPTPVPAAETNDEDVLAWLREQHAETGDVPGRAAVQARWAIGWRRADRLRAEAVPAGKPTLVKAAS